MPVYCSCTCWTLAVAGRVIWNRVCPSFHPTVCRVAFLDLDFKFLNFGMVLENLISLYVPDFLGKLFCPQKLGTWAKNRPPIGFFESLKRNLVINFPWFCSIIKIYIICCVPVQIFCWEKCCYWGIGQNALSHSDCGIFKWSVSPEQINEAASFCACSYKLTKIKSWWKSFWWGMVKNNCCQSGLWTLKLTVSQE